MEIVLTNDDGYGAPGLETLRRICEAFGRCRVVAPSDPQSGVGHAVTTSDPLHLREHGADGWSLDGTPADCARVALSNVAPDADFLIAGINHGANLGSDTYVSGTVAAAREAALLGRPAIAISQYAARHRAIDWDRSERRAAAVLAELLKRPPPRGVFWNVNLPHPADDAVACEVVECPMDPSPHAVRYVERGGRLHWQTDYHQRPRLPDHDVDVCFGGRIAVTSIRIGGAR